MTVFIHPSAEVHPSAEIGDGTYIWNSVQVRENAKIGQNCTLGKGVYIDIGVKLGNRVKVQNGVSVYAGVEIEDEVFVGPSATFTNDMFPRATVSDWKILPTKLEFGCSIGANATILCGVVIGQFAMVSAGSVVTRNVSPYALMAGNPSRLVGFVCKKGHPIIKTNNPDKILQLECPTCGEKLNCSASVDSE